MPSKSRLLYLIYLIPGFFQLQQSQFCFACNGDSSLQGKSSTLICSVSTTPLASFQNQLLDLAFETASAIPENPHRKDRARIQAEVVTIGLQLNQPNRVVGYIVQMEGWRRGLCYADLAFYCAQQKCRDDAITLLGEAESLLKTTDEWQKDRIRVRIAQTYELLGQSVKADEFEQGVVDSEVGKVAGTRARVGRDDSFDELIKSLDQLVTTGSYDVLANALQSYALLFNRFYAETDRRSLIENQIEKSWSPLPIIVRIELLEEMAGYALDHADSSNALEWINKAQSMIENCEWPLENRISLIAQLSELYFRAGDRQRARTDLDRARSLMNEQGDSIVDIYRAGAIRSLAQAYRRLDDNTTSLNMYKLAVEAGIKNPNSRPRAEDLSATCASMALNAVEPDEQLWTKIHQIREGLGQPW